MRKATDSRTIVMFRNSDVNVSRVSWTDIVQRQHEHTQVIWDTYRVKSKRCMNVCYEVLERDLGVVD